MRKRILSFLLIGILCLSFTFTVHGIDEPVIEAGSAILAELKSGEILFEQDADKQLYPASMTKIMTAIIALEYGDLNGKVTVNQTALNGLAEMHSSIYLIPGEEMPFMDMLHYLLILSGNDAGNVLAENVSGNIADFVALMNLKAQELGCTNTHFSNTHGLHEETHYSSARDMLKMSMYAMENPTFREIVAKTSYTVAPTNKHEKELLLTTTNYLLNQVKNPNYIYPGAIGIKTGFTTPAGYCLSAAAEYEDYTFYTVVFGAPQEAEGVKGRYGYTVDLFNYAAKNFSQQTMVKDTDPIVEVDVRLGKDKSSVVLTPQSSYSAYLRNDFAKDEVTVTYTVEEDIVAPIVKGDVLGKAKFTYDGKVYAEIDLVASEDIERSGILYTIDRTTNFLSSTAFKIIIGVILGLIVLFVTYVIFVNRRRAKKRARYNSGRGKHRR